jgi:hypothetical protein
MNIRKGTTPPVSDVPDIRASDGQSYGTHAYVAEPSAKSR